MAAHITSAEVANLPPAVQERIAALTPLKVAKTRVERPRRARRQAWSPVLWQVIFLVVAVDVGLWIALMIAGR